MFVRSVVLVTVVLLGSIQARGDNGKCGTCQFLVETFSQRLKNTANQHFAGGDTAWEEKNLGKYATSETRLIEVLEGVCKKRTLSNTDKYGSVKELEFKCSHLLEENEEHVEKYYFNHQSENMVNWLCRDMLKVCCDEGSFGKSCSSCPGVKDGAKACFGQGSCDGDGTRVGSGQCKCDKGYIGLMCRQCDPNYYTKEKTETSVECSECPSACSGGCSGSSPSDCVQCATGYSRNEQNECVDVDECAPSENRPCTKSNEQCVNSIGSYSCECASGFKRNENSKECEVDVTAPPYTPLIRPDLFLRLISLLGLFGCVTLAVWRRSLVLYVLISIAVFLFIVIELFVNPDTVPPEVKKHFEL